MHGCSTNNRSQQSPFVARIRNSLLSPAVVPIPGRTGFRRLTTHLTTQLTTQLATQLTTQLTNYDSTLTTQYLNPPTRGPDSPPRLSALLR
jgi:hypothetical protein